MDECSAILLCFFDQGIHPHFVKMSIHRKPLRKEENGTSRGEYAMSIRNKKAMGTNNTVV